MYLIQLLLPLYSRQNTKIPEKTFVEVHRELTQRFGGVTAYTHSPATGLWKKKRGDVERDLIILIEVLTQQFNRSWWLHYRRFLEKRFDQDKLLARVLRTATF